ncbi:MAG: lamin tail domain-containing protein, partial [Acidobacteriota bacterium]
MSFALPRFAPQRSASTRRPTASLTPRRISILILALALLPWLAPAAGAQAPADLFISEYIEGGGNNKAIEIYNGTGAAIDLGAGNYQLLFYFNGSSSAGNTIDLTGTVNDGDVFVLSENNASAAILALADQTDNGSFYNGDDAVELRANGTTLDVIGQIGDDPGSAWSNGGVSTQNDTLRRKADICDGDTDGSNAFDPSVEWDGFPQDNIDNLGAHTANCTAAAPVINEFVANHTSSDTSEFVEIFGDANTDYSAFTILEIEGDSAAGTIDGVYTVGTTDASGYWTTGFLDNEFENGSLTILLVEGFTGSAGDDLDTDNDGLLDVAPWSELVDSVSVDDGGGSDGAYGTPVLDAAFDGGSFTVGGASRIPNGTDTDDASDWVRNDFDGDGLPCCGGATADPGEALNTPAAENEVATAMASDPVINEFVLSHAGTDTSEFIEIFGDASTDYSALTILQIEGDGSLGEIDAEYSVGTTDANGYWTTGFLDSEWENGTLTILLVEDFNPAMEGGLDLDTNDDGTLDITPWSRIVDAVGISDGGGSDATY